MDLCDKRKIALRNLSASYTHRKGQLVGAICKFNNLLRKYNEQMDTKRAIEATLLEIRRQDAPNATQQLRTELETVKDKLAAANENLQDIKRLKDELKQLEPLRREINQLKRKLQVSKEAEEATKAKLQSLSSENEDLKDATAFYVKDVEEITVQYGKNIKNAQKVSMSNYHCLYWNRSTQC